MGNGYLATSQLLVKQTDILAEAALARYYRAFPGSRGLYDPEWRKKSFQDMRFHVLYLAEALGTRRPELFSNYAIWIRDTLTGLGLPLEDITASFNILGEVICETFSDASDEVCRMIFSAIEEINTQPVMLEPSYIKPDQPLGELAALFLKTLIAGNRGEAARLVMEEFQRGTTIKEIYLHVFQPAQREIGRLWQTNQVSIAQEHFCTAATQLIMAQFYPFFFNTPKNGKVMVATCVGGEMHEIGMRMVADIFEMHHWDTYYIGANTPVKSVISLLMQRNAHLLGISTTMTFHVSETRRLIEAVRSQPECSKVKILVGGYPFNIAPDLWKEIGADGYGSDAVDAVAVANRLLEVKE
jgi:MerR family transcriptional regulator, light-induced transcriptional regulator